MVGCMPLGGTQQGGRRRRGKGKTRKMRGGNFYSVLGGDSGLGTAGARYDAQPNSEVDPKTLQPVPESILSKTGGRRRGKKSRKGRKGRKGRKTMRGGRIPGSVNVAPVGYGFSDTSVVTRGPANATGYAANVGGAPADAAWVRVA